MSSNDHTQPRFHRGVTFFLALLLSMSVCILGAGTSLQGALVFDHPAATAREHFERTIAYEQAVANEPEWLRRPLLLFLGRVRPALPEAIDVYEEVVELQVRALRGETTAVASDKEEHAPDSPAQDGAPADAKPKPTSVFGCTPTVVEPEPKDTRAELCELLARRAILQGEAGRFDDLLLSIARIEGLGERELARTIRAAYSPPDARVTPTALAIDMSLLQPGWARDRFELRCAERSGDTERVTVLTEAANAREDALRRSGRTVAWALLTAIALGLGALLVWLLRDRPALPCSTASIPPEWNFEDGLAVLLRALALGAIGYLGVRIASQGFAEDWLFVGTWLATPLPLLYLYHKGLIAPRALSRVRVLGIDAFPGGVGRWALVVFGLFTADQLGQSLILELCGHIGLGQPWVESAQELLLRISPLAFAATCAVAVLWSPFVDELARRGLLFLTLRARMPLMSAALWSSALVAAFQNLSLPAFLMTIWSGFLCALAFERTKSILPAVIAQTLGYAGFLGAFAAFYR
ncbi:MAG: CPBP family intramembrane metalloprotease [Planctomycetes bacterium]|nr:CPBP family intramembrane metalloprotease [Planctomycetota bacterium]